MENNLIVKRDYGSLLNKIASVILLVVTFLLPIFFVPTTFISTQFGTSLLFAFGVIAALLLYIVSCLLSGSIELPRPANYMLWPILIVPLVYVLAGISNGFSRMTFLGYTFDESTVGFIVLVFTYLFLFMILFRDRKRIFYSYIAFVASSIIFSLFLLIRIIFGANVLSFGMFTTLTSTMLGSWNSVGIFFGVGAILSLLTYEMLNVSKLLKIVLTIALLFSLFFLALVNFSTIWIILGITSLLFILYRIFNPVTKGFEVLSLSWKQRIVRAPLYSTIVLVISVIFVIWGSSLGGYLATKLNVSNVEVRPSLSVTLEIAKNTLRTRPLFGSGPNTFLTQWLSYKPDDITASIFWDTDFTYGMGILPTFAVTTGVIGVLSWLLFFALYLYLGVKSMFAKIDDQFTKYLLISSFFASLFLWIMAVIYVPSSVVFILTFFFTGLFFASVYLSGIAQIENHIFANNPKKGFVSSLVLVGLFVAASALGYGLFKNSQSLWYFQKSSYALNTTGDLAASEGYMLKAIEAVPYDVYYRALSEIELAVLGKVVNQDPKKVTQEEVQKQVSTVLSNAISAGLAARNADPANYLNWISLGRVYESVVPLKVQGAYESAQFSYSEALRRNPKNPAISLLFSRLEIDHGNLNNAKVYALQAIQAKQNYLDAYYLLSQIEVANKNLKGAIDSVSAAAVLSPNDASIFFQLGLLKYNAQDFPGAIQALEKSLQLAPDYANAKYFLGLSYEITGQHDKAIAQFTDLKKTNPDNKEVDTILVNLQAGKPIFTNAQNKTPEKGKTLPVKEQIQ